MINGVSAISEYDVDDPNAWWVRLRGEPGIIIQGGIYAETYSGSPHSFPIAYPNSALGLIATNSDTMWGEFGVWTKIIDKNSFSIGLSSDETGPGSSAIYVFSVGY